MPMLGGPLGKDGGRSPSAFAAMSYRDVSVQSGAPTSCESCRRYALRMRTTSGMLTAVNRPPGCMLILTWLLPDVFSRTDATSNFGFGSAEAMRLGDDVHGEPPTVAATTRAIVKGDVRESSETSTRRMRRTRFNNEPPVAAAARLSSPALHASSSVSAAA